VKQAIQYFAKMQDYLNPDHAALTWDQAVSYCAALTLGGQSWLTGTDEGLFAGLAGQAQCFRVRDARILAAEMQP
jgi:hypothetical protein